MMRPLAAPSEWGSIGPYIATVFLKESDDKPITITPFSDEIISDIVLDTNEVFQVLYNLDPNKASGPDNIPIRLLKECANSIAPSLTCLLISTNH